jgi:predicted anti-sigma-YlaC factor YlaD
MTLKAIATALWALGSLVAVAWLVEAFTVGRGFVSTYLAPLAFGPLVVAALIQLWVSRSGPAGTRDADVAAEPDVAPDRPR